MSVVEVKVEINIPFDKWFDEIEAALAEGMRDLMMKAHGEWQDAAARTLHSTKRMYQDAIQFKVVDDRTTHLFLSHNDQKKNWLVNALELGHGPMLPWRATLAGRKAFYWNSGSRRGTYKWSSYAAGYEGRKKARKPPGGYKPFMDIPQWGKGVSPIEGRAPAGKDAFKRMTAGNSARWTHPGFKPEGKGGLDKPLREDVIQLVKDEAPKIFKKLIEQVVSA